jgi:hypothetical protein
VTTYPQPEYLTNAKADPTMCRCHHRKHFARCLVAVGTPMQCLCEEFQPEDLVYAGFRAIAKFQWDTAMRAARAKHTAKRN